MHGVIEMSKQHYDYEQVLEQAFATMRDVRPLGDVPSEQILQRVAAPRGGWMQRQRGALRRIHSMKFTAKVAAAVALALLGTLVFLVLNGAHSSLAFGDVVKGLREAHTMTCELTVTPADRPAMKVKAMFLGSRAFRTETDTAVTVTDAQEKTVMTLDLSHKTAFVIRAGKQGGHPTTAPGGEVDWLDQLKNMDEKSGKPIGTKEIAGTKAQGFKVTDKSGEFVVWADAKTGAPLRVEVSVRMQGAEWVIVLDQIALNVDLPESLFSVVPPPGYVVKTTETSGGAAGEQDMLAFLRDYAKQTRTYPPSLDDWNKTYEALLPKDNHKKADPAALSVLVEGGQAASFLGSLPKDSGWHYAGSSVRPGEAKMLFWYRPAESRPYRAIYGDLRIADVNERELPK